MERFLPTTSARPVLLRTGLLAAFALLVACGETLTPPQPLDVPGPAFTTHSNGAIVDRFAENQLILLTLDPDAGLYSVHYSDSDVLADFIGCPVPPFFSTVERLNVAVTNGRIHDQASGETYVIVNDLADFPANTCDQPMAEGVVQLHLSVNVALPGAPGGTTASFGSNGVITHNATGEDVRLHHKRSSLANPLGEVRLR